MGMAAALAVGSKLDNFRIGEHTFSEGAGGLKPKTVYRSTFNIGKLHSALSLGRPCLGHAAGKSHHKATAMAQGIPPAAAMACYRRSRLPFDRLQTLKTLKCLAGRLRA